MQINDVVIGREWCQLWIILFIYLSLLWTLWILSMADKIHYHQ